MTLADGTVHPNQRESSLAQPLPEGIIAARGTVRVYDPQSGAEAPWRLSTVVYETPSYVVYGTRDYSVREDLPDGYWAPRMIVAHYKDGAPVDVYDDRTQGWLHAQMVDADGGERYDAFSVKLIRSGEVLRAVPYKRLRPVPERSSSAGWAGAGRCKCFGG